jgi:membrane-bound lytic murein transglycosylase D
LRWRPTTHPGTVQAAVKRTGYADFWELYRRNVLPKETRNYVPIILAVTIMAKNPSQYGLDEVVMEKPSDYDTITINHPVDLRLVAECVGSTSSELQDLNPSLLRMTTPRDGKFELHLPAGRKSNTRPRSPHPTRHAALVAVSHAQLHSAPLELISTPPPSRFEAV